MGDFKNLVEALSAALTPVIAIVAVYVAYQQWRTNKTRLTLELYDRRLAVFKAVKALYGEMATLGKATYAMVLKFRSDTAEAEFLFGNEIEKHLDDLYKKGIRLAALHEQMYPSGGAPGLPVGPERSKIAAEHGDLLLWFLQDAQAESHKRFGKYLKLN